MDFYLKSKSSVLGGYGITLSMILFCLPLFLLTTFFPLHAHAAATITHVNVEPKGDFIIEPAKIEAFVDPGGTITQYINVTSRVPKTTSFEVDVEDFVGTSNPEVPIQLLGQDKGPYSIKDRVQLDSTSFTLDFGQKITIPVHVTIPADTPPGGFYAAIIVSNAPSQASSTLSSTGTRIVSRAGALLFVRVNGNAKEEGHVEDFRLTPHKLIYQPGMLMFESLFKNTGNVYLAPYGTIAIKNIFGHDVATQNIDAYYSLPHSERYRQVTFDGSHLFGRYTATLTLNKNFNNPGQKNNFDIQTISFWVIPWKMIVIAILLIIVVGALGIYISKNFEIKKK